VPPGPLQDELTALAGGGELVVADGNHRSLAAQTAPRRRRSRSSRTTGWSASCRWPTWWRR
jgi:hypothetical protein